MLGGARLSLSDPALLMASVRIASTYGDDYLAGSHPGRSTASTLELADLLKQFPIEWDKQHRSLSF